MIAFLSYLKYERGIPGPHLIVVPLSVMSAWMAEFKRWSPGMRVVRYHGPLAERRRLQNEDASFGNFDCQRKKKKRTQRHSQRASRFFVCRALIALLFFSCAQASSPRSKSSSAMRISSDTKSSGNISSGHTERERERERGREKKSHRRVGSSPTFQRAHHCLSVFLLRVCSDCRRSAPCEE